MRVISGKLGGQQFDAPKTHRTHPMSERMRGALFNALGDIEDLTILDCFGGSGALSIEAISRGAQSSTIIEVDKTAHSTITKNIKKLGLETAIKVVRANVSSWSDNNSEAEFDLVLCNPPFDGLKVDLIQKLTKHIRVKGVLVLSWPAREAVPKLEGLQLVSEKEKDYGDALLAFYRKTG